MRRDVTESPHEQVSWSREALSREHSGDSAQRVGSNRVADVPQAQDEYDSYVGQIYEMLIRQGDAPHPRGPSLGSRNRHMGLGGNRRDTRRQLLIDFSGCEMTWKRETAERSQADSGSQRDTRRCMDYIRLRRQRALHPLCAVGWSGGRRRTVASPTGQTGPCDHMVQWPAVIVGEDRLVQSELVRRALAAVEIGRGREGPARRAAPCPD